MTRDTLEQNQIPIYFASVVLVAVVGLLAPSMAQGVAALVTPAIAVLMYAMFLQIPFLDLRQGLGNKHFMAALLLANFILIPLLVWALTWGLVEHPAILVGALLVIPAAAARLLSQSLKGFFWISVVIATVSTLCGILLPIIFDLPVPSGAAIILVAGIAFALAAIARGTVPSLKGNLG